MFGVGNHDQNYYGNSRKDPSIDKENFRPFPTEYANTSGGECGVPLFYRYKMPENGNPPFW